MKFKHLLLISAVFMTYCANHQPASEKASYTRKVVEPDTTHTSSKKSNAQKSSIDVRGTGNAVSVDQNSDTSVQVKINGDGNAVQVHQSN